jgi:hypothetical protein
VAKNECEFLYGAELSNRIRKVCDAADVDCAVAFWGVGMKGQLFPQWGDGKIRIVCDISMGATCRAALGELGAPCNKNLRVHDGLHGKIYLSALGAVIGSPNASDNGVGRNAGASGNLLEAGVFCPAGSKAYVETARWSKKLFFTAPVVGRAELLGAPAHSGELRPRGSRLKLASLSLLHRLKDFPQNFPGVQVAIATGPLDEDMAEASKKERAKTRGTAAVLPQDDVILQNDMEGELQSFSGPLLLLWRDRSVTRVFAYMDCSTWPPSNPDTVFGIENRKGFWKAIDQEPSESRLTDEESTQIGQMLAEKGGQWLFTASEFAARLATSPV